MRPLSVSLVFFSLLLACGGDDDVIPPMGCGDITVGGQCEGEILRYCDLDAVVTIDCTTLLDASGAPARCASVPIGFACVGADSCAGETLEGRCDGNTIVRCESFESGNIGREDCAASGLECGVGASGIAECRMPGSAGCGGVTYQGYCEGAVVVWCDPRITDVARQDCGAEGFECGWVDDETGYWCVNPPSTTGANAIIGTVYYDKRPATASGLGGARPAPVRNGLVQIRRASDDGLVAQDFTNATGGFTIRFDDVGSMNVVVIAAAENETYRVSVRDCPSLSCAGSGNVYAADVATVTAAPDANVGTVTVSEAQAGGAFNIFDAFIRGFDFAWRVYGEKPPSLVGEWIRGMTTSCETSCYSRDGLDAILITSLAADTDEYDDSVLGHEFGHFLEASFSRSDSPGGSHDGSPTNPVLAWSEGYGTYVGGELFDTSMYVDTSSGGASVIDISNTGYTANMSGAMSQLVSEYMVSELLWKMSRGSSSSAPLGAENVFDVLGSYFPYSLVDRGVRGVDLVDFLDGWFCRGHGHTTDVQSVVNAARFPYDYAGPASCKPTAPFDVTIRAVSSGPDPRAFTVTVTSRAAVSNVELDLVLPQGAAVLGSELPAVVDLDPASPLEIAFTLDALVGRSFTFTAVARADVSSGIHFEASDVFDVGTPPAPVMTPSRIVPTGPGSPFSLRIFSRPQ